MKPISLDEFSKAILGLLANFLPVLLTAISFPIALSMARFIMKTLSRVMGAFAPHPRLQTPPANPIQKTPKISMEERQDALALDLLRAQSFSDIKRKSMKILPSKAHYMEIDELKRRLK